jgi:hypothetical protein
MATSTLITDYLGEGLASARPASLSIAGSALGLYVATDTGALSIWYSGAWHVAGLLPSIASGDLIANTGTGSAVPIGVSLTSLIDLALGNTQGDIIFRSGTSWAVLAPGTSGNVLATQGTGANPHWISPPASGVTSVVAGAGLNGGTITSTGTIDINFGTVVATAAQGNDARIIGAEQTANKGVAGGYASLDGSGKVPTAQLPASAVGGLTYQGTWNASTNSPTLASGTGTTGFYYVVATAGTTTIDGVSVWGVGDWISFDGTKWDKLDGSANPVSSVAGRQGAVTLAFGDISGLNGIASQTAPASGPIYSDGTVLVTMTLGTNLSFSSGTLTLASTPTLSGLIVNANTTTAQAGPTGTEFQVVGPDGVTSRILLDAYNAPATWTTRRAGGTNAVPTALPINTAIATYNAIGHQGTAYSAGHIFMTAVTGEAWTPTAQGHYVTFNYAANGGTVVSEGMRLNTTGNLLLGTTTDDGANKLQVSGGVKVSGRGVFGATAVTAPFIVNSGTATPKTAAAQSILQFTGDSGGIRVEVDAYGGTPQFTGARASGTQTSPSAVTANSALFSINGFGYGATGWSTVVRGSISITAAETWTDTAQGTYIPFNVTTIGGTTTVEKARLSDAGHILVGTTIDATSDLIQANGGIKGTVLTASSMPTTDPAVTGELWVTTSGQVASSGTAPSLPLGFIIPGKPAASAPYNLAMGLACSINANFSGTVIYDGTQATSSAVFSVNKISGGSTTAIGTLTITTASHVSFTPSTQAAVALAVGDVLQLVAPSSQDATLADLGITILATKV